MTCYSPGRNYVVGVPSLTPLPYPLVLLGERSVNPHSLLPSSIFTYTLARGNNEMGGSRSSTIFPGPVPTSPHDQSPRDPHRGRGTSSSSSHRPLTSVSSTPTTSFIPTLPSFLSPVSMSLTFLINIIYYLFLDLLHRFRSNRLKL